ANPVAGKTTEVKRRPYSGEAHTSFTQLMAAALSIRRLSHALALMDIPRTIPILFCLDMFSP
ncbi:hypothetical protein KIF54_10750, partial [Chromobacterium subtsugae]